MEEQWWTPLNLMCLKRRNNLKLCFISKHKIYKLMNYQLISKVISNKSLMNLEFKEWTIIRICSSSSLKRYFKVKVNNNLNHLPKYSSRLYHDIFRECVFKLLLNKNNIRILCKFVLSVISNHFLIFICALIWGTCFVG